MKSRRAQVSVEFIIFFGLGLVFFTAMLMIISTQAKVNMDENEQLDLEEIVSQVYKEVLLASTMQNGYERTFTLPEKIGKKSYIVEILNNTVVVARTSEKEASRQIFFVQGNLAIPTNTIVHKNDTVTIN